MKCARCHIEIDLQRLGLLGLFFTPLYDLLGIEAYCEPCELLRDNWKHLWKTKR